MTLTDWNGVAQLFYNITGGIAALGTVGAAIYAARIYKSNSRLERARWASSLYEKFYERQELKKVRDALDCDAGTKQVDALVSTEDSDFTDYLNFFEYVAFLKHREQLKLEEVHDLFGYYLGCLSRHAAVREYIRQNGYERLDALLNVEALQ
jgi:hypothetical protein